MNPVTGIQANIAPLEIIDDKHGRASTIIASQLPVEKWHERAPQKAQEDTEAIPGKQVTRVCLACRVY